jgi:hypothetical protein
MTTTTTRQINGYEVTIDSRGGIDVRDSTGKRVAGIMSPAKYWIAKAVPKQMGEIVNLAQERHGLRLNVGSCITAHWAALQEIRKAL